MRLIFSIVLLLVTEMISQAILSLLDVAFLFARYVACIVFGERSKRPHHIKET